MADKPLSIREVTTPESDDYIASRSFIYREIAAGRLRALKFGRSIRILRSERERYLASRPGAEIRLGAGKK